MILIVSLHINKFLSLIGQFKSLNISIACKAIVYKKK